MFIVTDRYVEPTKCNDDVDPTLKKDKRESKKSYTTITIVLTVAIISIDDANITTQNMDCKKALRANQVGALRTGV